MKKLLNKILPKIIVNQLVKYKYKKYNIEKHKYNIENNLIVDINCISVKKNIFLKNTLKKSFSGFLDINKYRLYFHPIAIIKIPKTIDVYLKNIGAKSRNMNVKAQKNGVACKTFNWNDYLDDIYEINTSSINRQGRTMDEAYLQHPKKIEIKSEEDFSIEFVGAFKDEKLIGYVELYIYGNFSMTNRILGHKNYFNFGMMNLLIKECVEYAIKTKKIEYINYLTMQNKDHNSLSAFKNRVGFREYSLMELK